MSIKIGVFKKAYKKLKSNVYFDKTALILRNKIVEFESDFDIDSSLKKLHKDFVDPVRREKLFNEILSSISFSSFPKKLKTENNKENDDVIINNFSPHIVKVDKEQYHIDMDVRGHILGVLWVMLIGYRIDKNLYMHSYGNRVKENLYNEFSGDITYSPYLFKPYFRQYENWRDNAMDKAQNLINSGQDAIIITMDFSRFYYSVDISKTFIESIYDEVKEDNDDGQYSVLNDFIYSVIERYSKCFPNNPEVNGRKILPIGFLPSNIIANRALSNFDKAIIDLWNPIYYGRYVDDIIIVDKIESKSSTGEQLYDNKIGKGELLDYYFVQCPYCNSKDIALFKKEINNKNKDTIHYVLNSRYNPSNNDKSKITLNTGKVSIFFFKSGENDSLIKCFRENIARNKSEFRHLPEDEAVFQQDDYSEIYELKIKESLNKLNGVTGIEIDKYNLSKLLGKYLRIGGLVKDNNEKGFVKNINKIFDARTLIENYSTWEKVIHILYINGFYEKLVEFIEAILTAIGNIQGKRKIKESLREHLKASLCKALALSWGKKEIELITEITELKKIGYSGEDIKSLRKGYYKTRMIDKSLMPILPEVLNDDITNDKNNSVHLTDFYEVIKYCKEEISPEYKYYPYIITAYDLAMMTSAIEMCFDSKPFTNVQGIYEKQKIQYIKMNYDVSKSRQMEFVNIHHMDNCCGSETDSYLVAIEGRKKPKVKIGVANVKIDEDCLDLLLKRKPNRSYDRYLGVSKVINAAIDEKVDILVMPECFVPFEWIPTIARTCERNNLAIVTGIEHIVCNNKVYNLTAVILPYEDEYSQNAMVSLHLKTHYAPAETEMIKGYSLTPVEGNSYTLYKWHDNYFPVYCCYELSSICDRAIFQSYADFVIAIEWNKDTIYYSNIIESLSRDLHCFCIQVNSSDYGDSRITKPSSSVKRDVIKVKGGSNNTILVGEIDVNRLRAFQIMQYNLQQYDTEFKPTPAGFNSDIALRKYNCEEIIINCED